MSESLPSRLRTLVAQVVKFSAVGGVGFLVDIAVFNALLLTPTRLAAWPLIAKTVSTALAIGVNWVGNRLWTFREQRRADAVREALEFFAASAIGSAVSLLCLGVSHYLLHLTTTVDDNVSANVVGLIVGSAVRFAAYRWWVFADRATRSSVHGAVTAKVTVTVAPTP